jgi:hypothetical protein
MRPILTSLETDMPHLESINVVGLVNYMATKKQYPIAIDHLFNDCLFHYSNRCDQTIIHDRKQGRIYYTTAAY